MKYRSSYLTRSTANTVVSGLGRAKVSGVQLTRSREWWISRPGDASNEEAAR